MPFPVVHGPASMPVSPLAPASEAGEVSIHDKLSTRRRVLRTALAATLLPSLAALAACSRKAEYHGIDLSQATFATDFKLQDPAGKERTLADFPGKAVMVFFGFTQCPDVCPTALARAVEMRGIMGADADKVQVIFITIDPERDTPEVLKAYTEAFDPTFVGLRGDLTETKATADAFKVFYQKVPTGTSYTMDHTSLTYVFDQKGKLRLALRHDQSAQECASDIKTLMATA
ncbi:SCO family protein [Pigmentiphaga litoralis]|uniref:SCO family protein n=1 Tax=Pigmentiphaga litoralis TaxID=516702 RepID=UPI003B432E1B